MNDLTGLRSNERTPQPDIPDHADALATILERCAARLRDNVSAEDLARELLPIIRVAARYC